MGLSWASHGTLIYTSELILCSTISSGKPIKCCLSLFLRVEKTMRPIRSHVSCFFTCESHLGDISSSLSQNYTNSLYGLFSKTNFFEKISEKKFVAYETSVREWLTLEVLFYILCLEYYFSYVKDVWNIKSFMHLELGSQHLYNKHNTAWNVCLYGIYALVGLHQKSRHSFAALTRAI